MANDLDALYDSPPSPDPQEPAAPPAPTPAPSAEIEELRRELYQTKGMLAALAQQRQMPPPASAPAQETGNWQDREFLSEGEERLLLESTTPRATLNKMFNTVAKTVHEKFAQELTKRDEYLAQIAQSSQQAALQTEQARATQQFQTRFYEQHTDLAGDEPIVAQAAHSVAQEYAQQPWRFGSAEAILSRIGEVARETKKGYLTRWSGRTGDQSVGVPSGALVNAPARRAAMETGGSTRVGLPSPPKDAQVKAISDMITHVRGVRR